MIVALLVVLAGALALEHEWPRRRWPLMVVIVSVALMFTGFRHALVLGPLLPWLVWLAGLLVDGAREKLMEANKS